MYLRPLLSFLLSVVLVLTISSTALSAQDAVATTTTSDMSIPHLVRFSGTLSLADLAPQMVGVTFALYREQKGGSPLWLETQNVHVDEQGHYSVLLGSANKDGLPNEIFISKEARWLGVKPEGQDEQPRILLVSVPYALKAGDAETLNGLNSTQLMAMAQPLSATSAVSADAPITVGRTGRTTRPPNSNPASPGQRASFSMNGSSQGIIEAYDDGANAPLQLLLNPLGGNVGIGTSAPAQKLSVAGTIESTIGGFKFPDGTTLTSATTVGTGVGSVTTTSGSGITVSPNTGAVVLNTDGSFLRTTGSQSLAGNFTLTGGGKFFGDGSSLSNVNAVHAISADTVTNGVYTTGSYTNPAWLTSLDAGKITGAVGEAAHAVAADSALTAATASSATNASSLGGVTAASYARTDLSNTFAASQTVNADLKIRKDVPFALGPVLTLTNGGMNGGSGAAIDFNGYEPSPGEDPTVRIQSIDDGMFSSHLAFWSKTPGTDGTGPKVERMRLTSTGQLGIGTATPSEALDVVGNLKVSGAIVGSGTSLTALDASKLTTGTLPSARLEGTYGSQLAFNNAGNDFTGTRLSTYNANGTAVGGTSASSSDYGVYGVNNANGIGVSGIGATGVYGTGTSSGTGVSGTGGTGVYGNSTSNTGTGVDGRGATGVYGQGTVYGVYGRNSNNSSYGQLGTTADAKPAGVYGVSTESLGVGVFGTAGTTSSNGSTYGVYGQSASLGGYGVYGRASATSGTNYGVFGESASPNGTGVFGTGRYGLQGSGATIGVGGYSPEGLGVAGSTSTATGIAGVFDNSSAAGLGKIISVRNNGNEKFTVYTAGYSVVTGKLTVDYPGSTGTYNAAFQANANAPYGIVVDHQYSGTPSPGTGIAALIMTNGTGIQVDTFDTGIRVASLLGAGNLIEGVDHDNNPLFTFAPSGELEVFANASNGVFAANTSDNGNGVVGIANNGSAAYGVWGKSTSGYAGYFSGNVNVTGTLSKSGGSFKIDHPLDPENKYLQHSFVESPDMMNIYNGNVVLDGDGEAWVQLPEWFEVLNRDFRYQLTAIGAPFIPYIAEEIANNRFKIAGGLPGKKVSWQVTGIRQDAWANAHRIEVEEEKGVGERGSYLHPELYGQSSDKSMERILKPRLPN
jgi:hypothetical protein